jgi:CubicO group peptidase (beta-lactamase class C family)
VKSVDTPGGNRTNAVYKSETFLMNKIKSSVVCLLLLAVCLVSTRAQVSASSESPVQSEEQLELFLKEQSNNGFSGSVLVARKNKIVLRKTYGNAAKLGDDPIF